MHLSKLAVRRPVTITFLLLLPLCSELFRCKELVSICCQI